MADDARLIAVIEANTKAFENALKRLEKTTEQSFRRQEQSVKKLNATMNGLSVTAGKIGKVLGGLGIATSLTGVAAAIRNVVREAGDLADMANRIGITAEQLQELQFAAEQAGGSAEGMAAALQFFSKNIGLAINGTGDLKKVLDQLHISLRDSGGNIKPLIQLFMEYSDAIKDTKNQQQQAALGAKAFGRSGGPELMGALRGGSQFFREMAQRAHDLGGVLTNEAAAKADAVDDAFNALVRTISVQFKEAVLGAMGDAKDIEESLKNLSQAIKAAGEWWKWFKEQTSGDAGQDIRKWVSDLDKAIGENMLANLDKAFLERVRAQLDLVNKQIEAEKAHIKELEAEYGGASVVFHEHLRKLIEQQNKLMEQERAVLAPQTAQKLGDINKGVGSPTDLRPFTEIKGSAKDLSSSADDLSDAADDLSKAAQDLEKRQAEAASDVISYIAKKEDFKPNAYYDVNHYRVGYGSDTMTDAAGNVTETLSTSSVTRAGALRDLERRIAKIQADLAEALGDKYEELSSGVIAALTDITYNYGTTPADVLEAARTGTAADVAAAIESHAGDNAGINRQRRLEEARMATTGTVIGAGYAEGLDREIQATEKAAEKTADLKKARDELMQSTEQQLRMMELELSVSQTSTFEKERALEAERLRQEYIQAGIPLDETVLALIQKQAIAYGLLKAQEEAATTATEALDQAQQDAAANMEEFKSFGASVLTGFVQDLREGKSAAEAFSNALDRIIDRLIEMAANMLFEALLPTGSAGGPGLLSSLFKASGGGIMTAHGKVPLRAYAGGGITRGPQMALFGEGSTPEAYVPVPTGKIPVTMKSPPSPQGVKVSIDLTGANGDETIRKISAQAAAQGVVQALNITRRSFGSMLTEYRLREG